MSYKFPPDLRLKSARDFNQVFYRAKKLSAHNFVLLFQTNNLDYPRLGIIIAKRNVAAAAARNRLRRMIKESFRLHRYIIKGYDVIFIGYKGINSITKEELKRCLEKQWLYLSKHQGKA